MAGRTASTRVVCVRVRVCLKGGCRFSYGHSTFSIDTGSQAAGGTIAGTRLPAALLHQLGSVYVAEKSEEATVMTWKSEMRLHALLHLSCQATVRRSTYFSAALRSMGGTIELMNRKCAFKSSLLPSGIPTFDLYGRS